MRKLIALLLLMLAGPCLAANPSLGIHVINTAWIGTLTYTSATGHNSAATGSSFVVFVASTNTGTTIADTINGSASGNTWTTPAFGSGTNPVQEMNDGGWLYLFLCTNCHGGTNHEVTVTATTGFVSGVDFIEIQNASLTAPIDQSKSLYALFMPNTNVTTTIANELILGAGLSNVGHNVAIAPTTGQGFTILDQYTSTSPNFSALGSADILNAAAGTYNPEFDNGGEGAIAAITVSLQPAGSACTHTGWNIATGAFSTPTAGSGTFWLKTGAKGSTDCSATQYWASTGAFVAN